MKKIVSLATILLLAAILCACGAPDTEKKPDVPLDAPLQELIALDTTALGNIVLVDADSNGTCAAMLYRLYENDEERCCLSLFDLRTNKETKRLELKDAIQDGYRVSVTDAGVCVARQIAQKQTLYDFNLENPVTSDYTYTEGYERASVVDAIDANRFQCFQEFAVSLDYQAYRILAFYDRPDRLHLLKQNQYYEYRQANGHQILMVDNSGNRIEDYRSVVRIIDFDQQTEVAKITIPNECDFNNLEGTFKLNDRCAVIATVKEDGFDALYVWNYGQSAENRPLEAGLCETVAVDEIEDKIEEACLRIKENTGVTVSCAPEMEFIKIYEISNDIKPIEFYSVTLRLEQYLSLLPKETYREIICRDLTDPVASFDDFRIYLVGYFPAGDVSAYEANLSCDETDNHHIVYIVYSCYGFTRQTFFHELMHAFEYRIWNYEAKFDKKWEAMNPKRFRYSDDYLSVFYDEANRDWQEYFARAYGMKSILEDRATCFEVLCDGMLGGSTWWKDMPYLMAKQQYLAQTVRKSFPSLQDAEILNIDAIN
jgi:hypothetical protein